MFSLVKRCNTFHEFILALNKYLFKEWILQLDYFKLKIMDYIDEDLLGASSNSSEYNPSIICNLRLVEIAWGLCKGLLFQYFAGSHKL